MLYSHLFLYTWELVNLCILQFQSEDSVEIALELNGENVKERPIRVNRCGNLKQHNKNPSTNTEAEDCLLYTSRCV